MRYAILIAAAFAATSAGAQTSADTAAPAPMAAPAAAPVPTAPVARALPANTIVMVTTTAELNSGRVEVGDRPTFTVVNDVVENGLVVIPRGTTVVGEITFKTGRAIGGKSGKFDITFRTISLGGRDYQMGGVHRQEGRGNTVGALLGSILISGRSAVLQPGTVVQGLTAEPIPY